MRAISQLSCSLLLLLFAASRVPATPVCKFANGTEDKHPNVILILADDLWWADLPWYSPPIRWQGEPQPNPVTESAAKPEYRIQQPTLNRLAARLLAQTADGSYGSRPAPPETGQPTTTLSGSVKPIDEPTADPMSYLASATAACTHPLRIETCRGDAECQDLAANAMCDRRRDVLEGFGGFRKIADNGAVFGRYYATSAFCGPARGSLITGRHTKRTGVGSNGGGKLQEEEVFISEWLRQGCPTPVDPEVPSVKCFLKATPTNPTPCDPAPPNDPELPDGPPCYYAGFIGKWHLGVHPWQQGFDESAYGVSAARAYFENRPLHCHGGARCDGDIISQNISGVLHVNGTRDKNDRWPCNDDSDDSTNEEWNENYNPDEEGCPYSTRVYERLAEEFIDVALGKPDRDGFFLVISLNAVHVPHSAPKRTIAHYNTANSMLDPRGNRDKNDTYWAAIEEIDASIGKLYDKLGDREILDNTVVMFTSDHGGATRSYGLPELRGGKGGIDEGGARVGLLASVCRNQIGDRSGHVTNHADLFPTIAEAAGVKVPDWEKVDPTEGKPIDGISLYSVLTNPTAARVRDYSFSRYHGQIINAAPGVHPNTITVNNRVCGYSGLNQFNVAVRGGSCTPCPVSGCAATPCKLMGKICVSDSPSGSGSCDQTNIACKENSDCGTGFCLYPTTPTNDLRRCMSNLDCGTDGTDEVCKEASVLCNECPPPAWKLRTPPHVDTTDLNSLRLYELTTNPEEIPELDCNRHDPLTTLDERQAWQDVRDALQCRVKKWLWCTADNVDGGGSDRDGDGLPCNAVCDKWGDGRACDNGMSNDYCDAIASP